MSRHSGTACSGQCIFLSCFLSLYTFRAHCVALFVLAGVYPLDNSFNSSSEANLNLLEGAASMKELELAAGTSGMVWSIFAEEAAETSGRVWSTADICGRVCSICSASYGSTSCIGPGQPVHSHIPRQKGL